MPVLDAKALETDPEGMAFLRAVLGPPRGRTRRPAAKPADRPQPAPPCEMPPPYDDEVAMASMPRETAPSPAA